VFHLPLRCWWEVEVCRSRHDELVITVDDLYRPTIVFILTHGCAFANFVDPVIPMSNTPEYRNVSRASSVRMVALVKMIRVAMSRAWQPDCYLVPDTRHSAGSERGKDITLLEV